MKNNLFLQRIDSTFSLEEIKNIMRISLNCHNNTEVFPNTYDAMKSIVFEKGQDEKLNSFVINIFQNYINNLKRIGRNNLGDQRLIKDYDLIMQSSTIQNFQNIKDLFSSPEFQQLTFKPIYPQDQYVNSSFIHINAALLNDFQQEDIECRFYLSPMMENLSTIATEIINKHLTKNLPCRLKINTDSNRNDRIVFYSSLKNASKHLEIFEEIKKEKPELFTNCNRNQLWGKIKNVQDIYFGMEPFIRYKTSYGQIRGALIDESIREYIHLYGNIDNNTEITDDMAIKFYDLLKTNCLIHNVDSENFAINKSKTYGDCNTPFILLGNDNNQIPIYIIGFNLNTNLIDITYNVNPTQDSIIQLTRDQLDLLYKHNETETRYIESENLRKKIAKIIQKKMEKQRRTTNFAKINPIKSISKKRIVQRSYDGKVLTSNGMIDYKLYMLLPQKIWELVEKVKVQTKNRNNNYVSAINTEEIASINEDISCFSRNEKQAVTNIILSGQQPNNEIKLSDIKPNHR